MSGSNTDAKLDAIVTAIGGGTAGPLTPAGSLSVVAALGTLYTWQVPCTTAGRALLKAWASGTAYAVGEVVTNDSGKVYKCITAGTSAGSGGPTGTSADITDNTVHWAYYIAAAPTFKGGIILRNKAASASSAYYDRAAATAPGGAEIPAGQADATFTTGDPAALFVAATSTATVTVAGYA